MHAQCYYLLHARLLSEGDILALQLMGTLLLCYHTNTIYFLTKLNQIDTKQSIMLNVLFPYIPSDKINIY